MERKMIAAVAAAVVLLLIITVTVVEISPVKKHFCGVTNTSTVKLLLNTNSTYPLLCQPIAVTAILCDNGHLFGQMFDPFNISTFKAPFENEPELLCNKSFENKIIKCSDQHFYTKLPYEEDSTEKRASTLLCQPIDVKTIQCENGYNFTQIWNANYDSSFSAPFYNEPELTCNRTPQDAYIKCNDKHYYWTNLPE